MFGKDHVTPSWEQTTAGPFDHWPTGLGFQYFYGFLSAETNQWAPMLVENTVPVQLPANDPSYILDRDLADHAITWIHRQRALTPNRPFFVYYADGSTHAPQQAPADWIAKFNGRFDDGWDSLRARIFARQKQLGILPADAESTPRPPQIPAWNSVDAAHRKLYARYMEAYAAQLAFSDAQIGRVIDDLRRTGTLDNTLVVFIEGDNGPDALGGPKGLMFEQAVVNPAAASDAYALAHIDDIGGPRAYNLYPAGWAWAMATPFQWFKQIASHFGGTRNGMVISWPARIKQHGGTRRQFAYIADIAPTLLEEAGIKMPAVVNGVPQIPLDGISLGYSFDNAEAPTPHQTQYFEMVQNVALYHDGWVAATHPVYMPWEFFTAKPVDLSTRQWELYNVGQDFSEAHDLAAANPGRLHQLQAMFMDEARRNNVLPLHPPLAGLGGAPNLAAGRTVFTYYPGMGDLATQAGPPFAGHAYEILADIEVPPSGAHGVLFAEGGRFGGHAFYLVDGKPAYCYVATPPARTTLRSAQGVPPGHHQLAVDFTPRCPAPRRRRHGSHQGRWPTSGAGPYRRHSPQLRNGGGPGYRRGPHHAGFRRLRRAGQVHRHHPHGDRNREIGAPGRRGLQPFGVRAFSKARPRFMVRALSAMVQP